jgi:hypothetical protein
LFHPCLIVTRYDLPAGFFHQPKVKAKILYAGNLQAKDFAGNNQVAQIGFTEKITDLIA